MALLVESMGIIIGFMKECVKRVRLQALFPIRDGAPAASQEGKTSLVISDRDKGDRGIRH